MRLSIYLAHTHRVLSRFMDAQLEDWRRFAACASLAKLNGSSARIGPRCIGAILADRVILFGGDILSKRARNHRTYTLTHTHTQTG